MTPASTRLANPRPSVLQDWVTRTASLALAFVAIIACQPAPTAPADGTDPRCFYKGDTIGVVIFRDAHGRITQCAYLGADNTFCEMTPVDKTPPPCTVGSLALGAPDSGVHQ
jgi:hypothetical protein